MTVAVLGRSIWAIKLCQIHFYEGFNNKQAFVTRGLRLYKSPECVFCFHHNQTRVTEHVLKFECLVGERIGANMCIWTGVACTLIACVWNTWGDNCQEECNCQDNQQTCHHVDGSCQPGCRTGYGGTNCNLGKIRNRAYEFHEMIIFANRHLTLFAFFMACNRHHSVSSKHHACLRRVSIVTITIISMLSKSWRV